jgi:glycine/D-amino acid oxidase-like deaminating enzyme
LHEGTFSTLEPTPEEQEILRAKFHEVMSFDIEGFEKIRKQFEKAEHVGAITALRPYRKSGVLVSAEVEGGKTVIHHVGHGGAGWTLAPGSAKDAVALIEQS